MLPAQLFQSAADELCTAWNGQGSKIYKWEWMTSKSAFAETLVRQSVAALCISPLQRGDSMLKQQSLQGGGYLAMCNIPVSAASQPPDTLSVKAGTCHDTDGTSAKLVSSGGACSSECDDEDDVACLPAEHDRLVHFYDYHIVYLPSYSVPTLLFHGHHKGMRRLNVACAQSLFIAPYGIPTQWLVTFQMTIVPCSECFKSQHMCVPSFLQFLLHVPAFTGSVA